MFDIPVYFFKQETAYEMRISDWSSDVCSSDLFDVEHAVSRPGARHHHRGADHRGDAGGIAHSLVAGFGKSVIMVADIVEIERLFLAVLAKTGRDDADVGLALGGHGQARRFGEHGCQTFPRIALYRKSDGGGKGG